MQKLTYQRKPKLKLFFRCQNNSNKHYLYFQVYFDVETSKALALRMTIAQGESWNKQTFLFEATAVEAAPEVQHKNAILTQLKADLDEIYYTLRYRSKRCSAQSYLEYLTKKRAIDSNAPTVLQAYKQYFETRKEDVKNGVLTYRALQSLSRGHDLFAEFLTSGHRTEMEFDELKPILLNQYESYLRGKNLSEIYVKKTIYKLQTVLKFSLANEWTNRNVSDAYRFKTVAKKPISYLTAIEIKAIDNAKILDPSMDRVRDVFIFSCWSGCAYSDLKALHPTHLFQSTDGVWYLKKPREKNTQMAVVPLAPRAVEILQKYKDHSERTGYLLPVISNQKTNVYLKALASIVGISRVAVSSHIARKSFATLLLNEGVSLDIVAATMGHSNTKTTTQFYAQMHEETVIKTVNEAFTKINQRMAV